EGAVMAGSQAEQIRQDTVDGRLTADQSLAGATTGVLGGLIGFAGGRIAQKLGIGDVDTMLVNGKLGPAEIAGEIAAMPAKSLPRRVVEGAISEGFLEELPQSVSEQILQNLALDRPWSDGIEDAAVMGTLAGMAMGGAANILSGHNTGTEPQNNQQQSGTPNLPSVPPQLGSSPDNPLTGEYIPRENVPQGDNQGRTAFVYDQPSMDADNLLSHNYEGDADFNTSGNLDPSNNPLSPSGGNYFEDHSTQPQLPSEHLGINPNDGPMSSAAALAVDSGTSQMLNMSLNDAKNEGPLSGTVTSEYQSLLASNNENFPVVTNGLDKTSQHKDGDVSQSSRTEQNKGIENLETAPPNLIGVMGVQSKVTELETQLANEKSVIKKVRLRKQIAELQKDNPIDQAAHAAATSIQNDLPEPSQAQIEAGNYKKGHIKVHGLDIAVENPRGSERRGTDPDGKEWAHTMSDHYGYIKRTTGADNENIDTYVGNSPESEQVYIVDQIDQKTGGFDEHKVMMGFNSQEDAIQAYSSNFDKGWKVGAVRAMNKDEFKSWLKYGDTKKPAGESAATQSETTLDPQRVQHDYGDNLESVMSDVETLVDDFTIDLHSVPKKRNALKNPNYHAVKHENVRVEILGMKHPATGKWIGKEPTQDKTLAHDSPAPTELQKRNFKSNFPENSDTSKPVATKPKKVIQDFGEKIGGARKDTAVKTGKKTVAGKSKDDRPTWAKRFEISEVAASSNPTEVGKWTISDNKNKDWMGNNHRLTNQIFNTQKEAESFLPVAAVGMKHRVTTDTKDGKKGYIIVRTVSDRKHVQVVQQLFDTREEANDYLVRHAQEILETNTTFGELDLPRPENTQRTGVARREGDAKDSDFSRVFGFRGVEFGNWNNQVERQELLNDAFDGLMDLAEVLNIPPEALSLNGELALAFGARGQGLSSAKAHYESNRVVINLTKMNGAGSLAHEWW
ncbi:MAG: PLxRFG domain-containing protein, partial [Acinetobacter sp.]